MDNLAHALVGAALGRAVAGHKVPNAAVIGVVAANAPDWTEVFVGLPANGPTYLAVHRGITHSLAGVAVQIVVLTALLALASVWDARRREGPPPAWGWIAACVATTVLSHPYMDWQGSYGLRPWLPWDGRWAYGDFVAIVDPFFWLVPLVSLALGAHRHWRSALGVATVWIPMAALVLVLFGDFVAAWVRVAFVALTSVAVVGWIRHWFGVAARRRAAVWGLAVLALYAAAQGIASTPRKAAIRAAAVERFGPAAQWAALTRVGHPFSWEPIYGSRDSVAGPDWQLSRELDHPAVRRALETPDARKLAGFARFLVADVAGDGGRAGGVTVYLWDARFGRSERESWARVAIRSE